MTSLFSCATCSMIRPVFKDFVDVALLKGELTAAMRFSSGEDLKFLLLYFAFACPGLGGSVKVTRYFSDETWLDTIFELLGRGLAVL